MAGMLPGVEAARRRRIHQRGHGGGGLSEYSSGGLVGGGGHSYNRRPVFCLFASGFETNPVSAISAERSGNGMMKKTGEDEMLGRLAREAKRRLDERLKANKSSFVNRNNIDVCEERLRCIEGRTMMVRELQMEVFGSSKKKLMLLKWVTKLGGK